MFVVKTHTHFDKLMKLLSKRYSELPDIYAEAVEILEKDPYNLNRGFNIKKLTNITDGLGNFRLRLGRWRFRYDIHGNVVIFYFCGLRSEDTYG